MGELSTAVSERLQRTHALILKVAEPLSDEQLEWLPSPTAPAMVWHLWHVARWSDRLQAGLPGADGGTEIWQAEGLARTWGFEAGRLGFGQTGGEMEPAVAQGLPWPDRDVLFGYARRSFTGAETGVASLSLRAYDLPRASFFPSAQPTTLGDDLIGHLCHLSRHLGMIEALRGVLGMRGSATI